MKESAAPMRVFDIPSGVSFVDALADGLMRQAEGDALRLAAMTVLLPTRRAIRALTEAFLRRSEGKALLLPRLQPLGDIDATELDFVDAGDELAGDDMELPPAIPAARRQLLLTELVLKFGETTAARDGHVGPRTPDQAARLANELARLLDQVHIEELSFDALADLVPADFAEHWQITLRFLDIVAKVWPRVLREEGCLDPMDRRIRLIRRRTELWRRHPPDAPVVAAGSTGSVSATADLLLAVAALPEGAVILPGLDRNADDETWAAIGEDPTHPQFGLNRLLAKFGIDRGEVRFWPTAERPPSPRNDLIALALRPAAVTERWREAASIAAAAVAGLERVDCANPQEEAGVIALILREALQDPVRTAAVITTDRDLARRIAVELDRWGIAIDDSAGRPLTETAPGAFLSLLLDAVESRFAPVPTLALFKHPLSAAGMEPAAFRDWARRLDRDALRGPRPAPGIEGLRSALPAGGGAKSQEDLSVGLDRVRRCLGALDAALAGERLEFAVILDRHIAAAEAFAATDREAGARRLWAGEAGEAAASIVADLREAAPRLRPISGLAYPALFQSLVQGVVVRPRYGRHPRLALWGTLEARLQQRDISILAGLNEGTWPPEPPTDPWMSRPMRRDFGLPAPERRIGLSAHDFAQALAAPRVVLTRSRRVDGQPTVPSRWLLRLDAVLTHARMSIARPTSHPWLAIHAALDRAERVESRRPQPRPPVAVRPRQLSVTEIETWMRDPYAIYARHVLGLRPLDPLDADPGAAERGSMIHEALHRFLAAFPDSLPDDAFAQLLTMGRAVFGTAMARPGVAAFWWPRFERIARWFVAEELARRQEIDGTLTEIEGRLQLAGPAGPFMLRGRADRIDRRRGGIAVIDYKTGGIPAKDDVALGVSPQLPLLALIAAGDGFPGLPPRAKAQQLQYWQLTGANPPGKIVSIGDDPMPLIETARAGLQGLIEAFDNGAPYLSRPNPATAPRHSDYEHLARVKEWSTAGDGA
jgi:ATP-dependent helicase/nuclease subunit B